MCAVRVMAVPDMTVVPMAARMLRMSHMTTVMAVGTMDGVHGMTARRSMRVGAWVRRITSMRVGAVAVQRAVRHRNEQENTGKPRATREDVQCGICGGRHPGFLHWACATNRAGASLNRRSARPAIAAPLGILH
jgi:hypothetical protein